MSRPCLSGEIGVEGIEASSRETSSSGLVDSDLFLDEQKRVEARDVGFVNERRQEFGKVAGDFKDGGFEYEIEFFADQKEK